MFPLNDRKGRKFNGNNMHDFDMFPSAGKCAKLNGNNMYYSNFVKNVNNFFDLRLRGKIKRLKYFSNVDREHFPVASQAITFFKNIT